jgi:hypothetical protein
LPKALVVVVVVGTGAEAEAEIQVEIEVNLFVHRLDHLRLEVHRCLLSNRLVGQLSYDSPPL